MSNSYTKILIIGENFHTDSGGGITLSNLFKKWPKNHLANATDYRNLTQNDDFKDVSIFELYKCKKIFNVVDYDKIGKFRADKNLDKQNSSNVKSAKSKHIFKKLFFRFLNYTNVKHLIFRYKISDEFVLWIKEFNPDYIYSSLGSYELILLVDQINKITNIPIAVHIMDDWPTWFGSKGLFKNYWKKRFDYRFRTLLNETSLFLSISDEMSEEYQKRYNKTFIPFHNPLDLNFWCNEIIEQGIPKNNSNHIIKVLHAGRIGKGIKTSLINAAKSIESLNQDGYNIEFVLQSTSIEPEFINEIKEFKCVTISPPAEYQDIPRIFKAADILLLCNDFDKEGISFLKYSMPTKASEYMITHIPIIIFSDKSIAVYKHSFKHKWAYLVGENNLNSLSNGIKELIENQNLSNTISDNAYNFAKENYDSNIVLEKFRKVFVENLQ